MGECQFWFRNRQKKMFSTHFDMVSFLNHKSPKNVILSFVRLVWLSMKQYCLLGRGELYLGLVWLVLNNPFDYTCGSGLGKIRRLGWTQFGKSEIRNGHIQLLELWNKASCKLAKVKFSWTRLNIKRKGKIHICFLAIGIGSSVIDCSRSKNKLRGRNWPSVILASRLLLLPLQSKRFSLSCSVTVRILWHNFSWVHTNLQKQNKNPIFWNPRRLRKPITSHWHDHRFTFFLSGPNFSNFTNPSIKEKIVWSLPIPTFFPAWNCIKHHSWIDLLKTK